MKQVLVVLALVISCSQGFNLGLDQFIVGGEDAQPGQFPWIGAIEYVDYAQVCAGSILSDRWFVTAGHCVYNLNPNVITFRVGSRYRETGGQSLRVLRCILHPEFHQNVVYNFDVAVCEVEGLMAGPGIRYIPLTREEPTTAARVFVSGWGVQGNGDPADILQFVNIPILNRDQCNATYNGLVTDTMICAGEAGRDICVLDNGGPLTDMRNHLVGIVSWGMGCGVPIYPGVYTTIANPAIRDFILENAVN
ncbi:trypsin [Sergentomyia squamirostris]